MEGQLPQGITRAMLARVFKDEPALVRAFEKVLLSVANSADVSTANAAATTDLQDATAVTLSPNAALNNERVLAVTSPLALRDTGPGNEIIVGFSFEFTVPTPHALNVNLIADTNITLPPSGRLLASNITTATYANDAAAGAAGLVVGDVYRGPTGTVVWKQT